VTAVRSGYATGPGGEITPAKEILMADDTREPTRPSAPTRDAEQSDARVHATPDKLPSPDEEAAAERAGKESADVDRNYEEAIERGARQEGEGRLP
jgi:hypothetical protein